MKKTKTLSVDEQVELEVQKRLKQIQDKKKLESKLFTRKNMWFFKINWNEYNLYFLDIIEARIEKGKMKYNRGSYVSVFIQLLMYYNFNDDSVLLCKELLNIIGFDHDMCKEILYELKQIGIIWVEDGGNSGNFIKIPAWHIICGNNKIVKKVVNNKTDTLYPITMFYENDECYYCYDVF